MELPGLSIYLLYIFCVPLPYLPSASHYPLHLTNLCIPLYPLTRNCLFTFIKLLVVMKGLAKVEKGYLH